MRRTLKILPGVLSALALFSMRAGADTDRLQVIATRYDQEYPLIAYSGPATHNRAWRLQQDLDSGRVKLEWEPEYGYLRSLLKALEVDIDSQILVFSKTSLQVELINAARPRAVYYNDDTYVGYVHGTTFIEFTVIDALMGTIFFSMDNRRPVAAAHLEREGGRCLTCHDTYAMMGGGVPKVLVLSAPVEDPSDPRDTVTASDVDDRTPLAQRWGGWYVTGRHGRQRHFGNLPLREERGMETLRRLAPERANLQSLAAYFDTSTYLSDQSDIVALLVLEHQSFVQNLITRVNYKVRTVLSRNQAIGTDLPRSWEQVTGRDQNAVKAMMEPLVRALFCHDAAELGDRIESSSGFAARFSASGPRDRHGRGLHELQLDHRLLRYPLSYLIYSDQFRALPPFAIEYIDSRIVEVLQGTDKTGIAARIAPADRAAITRILIDTEPRLAKRLQ